MSADSVEMLCERIRNNKLDENWRARAQARLNALTKPPGSLGRLEDLAEQFVAAREEDEPAIENPAVYVFAGDHGVSSEGVSAYPSEVTGQMVKNFLDGGAAVNVLASAAGVEVKVIDVGVIGNLVEMPGLINRKVCHGTKNFAIEPAMTERQMRSALEAGFEQGLEAVTSKRNLVIAGEMGIGNTTAAAAITAALTGAEALEVAGTGTGLTSEGVLRKTAIVQKAVEQYFGPEVGERVDPLEVLRCVGGFEIAAMTGLILKVVSERILVVLDGFISSAAGAIACALVPQAKAFLVAGHQSAERGHGRLLAYMGLSPVLQLEMRLGEGSGALLATLVIDAALKIYNQMATFETAQISGARE